MTMHPDQIEVEPDTVRQLVDEQFPQWQSLPIRELAASGTVNALFRIGDCLVARFPIQPGEVERTRLQLMSEADAARKLLDSTPFPTPEPIALGHPGADYPLPWSVQTWLPGTSADETDPGDSVPFAHDLASFVRAVRALETAGQSFSGAGRGGDLRDHDQWMETCFRNSEELLDVPRLRSLWSIMRDLPPSASAEVMTHGDLIPGNVLVSRGRLVGVIDVGGLGLTDPALDLVGAWHLLEETPRQSFRNALDCDDLEWQRGMAWAFEQAMGAVWYYVDSNPAMHLMGVRTLQRIMTEGFV